MKHSMPGINMKPIFVLLAILMAVVATGCQSPGNGTNPSTQAQSNPVASGPTVPPPTPNTMNNPAPPSTPGTPP